MGADQALSLLNQMLWRCVVVGGPVLGATLLVGLLVSIVQVTTQLQEITLSYVPKMLAAIALLIAIGPWMVGQITSFATALYAVIPTLGR